MKTNTGRTYGRVTKYLPVEVRKEIWRILDDLEEPLPLHTLADMADPSTLRKNLCGISQVVRKAGYKVQKLKGLPFVLPRSKAKPPEVPVLPVPEFVLPLPATDKEVSESFEERLEILVNLLLDCASKTEAILTEWRRMDIGRLYQFEAAVKRLVKAKE